jgi:hypothetical protein
LAIDALESEFRIVVIEGALETEDDTLRIRAHGVPACHLDASMLHEALHELSLRGTTDRVSRGSSKADGATKESSHWQPIAPPNSSG